MTPPAPSGSDGRPRLTYCGNVHAASCLEEWLATLARFWPAVARRQPRPFGLGVWWNAAVAAELARDPRAQARARGALAAAEVELWTLNVFPAGAFHGTRVKDAVYRPDWADPARLRYTLDAAEAAAALVPPGSLVPLSTLPLGFRSGDVRAMAAQLRTAAVALAELERRSGVCCVLALEPEPACLIETCAQAATFLEERVLACATGTELALRRHLGVCMDLCHLAVVGEEPLAALAALRQRGIAVPKIQVSACLELRDPSRALTRLLAWDEPRYLHQTSDGRELRALDLDEVRARREEFGRAERLRTHFHVPIYWDGDALGSTRSEVERVLRGLTSPWPLLEVETYTWEVLEPGALGRVDLVQGIRAELAFARACLPA